MTEIGPQTSPASHAFPILFPYSRFMRGAFVVQLGPESQPSKGLFEGWVQEVESCTELRFRSGEELLKFIEKRFELTLASAAKPRESNLNEELPCGQRGSRKARKSS